MVLDANSLDCEIAFGCLIALPRWDHRTGHEPQTFGPHKGISFSQAKNKRISRSSQSTGRRRKQLAKHMCVNVSPLLLVSQAWAVSVIRREPRITKEDWICPSFTHAWVCLPLKWVSLIFICILPIYWLSVWKCHYQNGTPIVQPDSIGAHVCTVTHTGTFFFNGAWSMQGDEANVVTC